MFDEEQIVPEEVVENVVEEAVVESAPEPARIDPQVSFRALREKSERIERERDAAMQKIQQLESRGKVEEEDLEINLGEDDLAEGKHLSKVSKKIKRLESELNQYKQQSVANTAEMRLKAQYPDFDSVVSADNLEHLKLQFPEISQTLHSGNDLYSTAVSAYTIIKRLGIHKEDSYMAEKALVQKNAAKPKSMASLSPQQGDSPLSHANAFANDYSKENLERAYREMTEARKGY